MIVNEDGPLADRVSARGFLKGRSQIGLEGAMLAEEGAADPGRESALPHQRQSLGAAGQQPILIHRHAAISRVSRAAPAAIR